MVVLAPREYCKIRDPKIMKDGSPLKTPHGNYRLNYGESEYRFNKDNTSPFPLYPGEI